MQSEILVSFLQAVLDEGHNPEDYFFDISEKKLGKKTNTGSMNLSLV